MLNDEKRGVEEAYTSAGNTSDLRVEADLRGDADLIIAAGWSDSRVGMALLRLHSEWDKAEKPRRPTLQAIATLEATLRMPCLPLACDEKALKIANTKARQRAAQRMAQDWYMREMAKLVNKLKSLPEVRRELTRYVPKWGIQEAAVKVPAVIAYWLDQTCHACNGLKFTQIANTPALSTKACKACQGSGIAPVPHGQEGRRVANYMDECLQKGRDSIRRNLSSYREPSTHKRGKTAQN
jgi:hypothetical protein